MRETIEQNRQSDNIIDDPIFEAWPTKKRDYDIYLQLDYKYDYSLQHGRYKNIIETHPLITSEIVSIIQPCLMSFIY